MLPLCIGMKAAGEVFYNVRIARKRGSCVAAFQQVMAEHAVLGNDMVEQLVEHLGVVNALSHKNGRLENVLINV